MILAAPVDEMTAAVTLNEIDRGRPLAATRLLVDMANVPRVASRVHELATWMLAVTQAIEAANRHAASLAVQLGAIVAECELIGEAAETNGESVTAAA